jgi:hypothetical protein
MVVCVPNFSVQNPKKGRFLSHKKNQDIHHVSRTTATVNIRGQPSILDYMNTPSTNLLIYHKLDKFPDGLSKDLVYVYKSVFSKIDYPESLSENCKYMSTLDISNNLNDCYAWFAAQFAAIFKFSKTPPKKSEGMDAALVKNVLISYSEDKDQNNELDYYCTLSAKSDKTIERMLLSAIWTYLYLSITNIDVKRKYIFSYVFCPDCQIDNISSIGENSNKLYLLETESAWFGKESKWKTARTGASNDTLVALGIASQGQSVQGAGINNISKMNMSTNITLRLKRMCSKLNIDEITTVNGLTSLAESSPDKFYSLFNISKDCLDLYNAQVWSRYKPQLRSSFAGGTYNDLNKTNK